MAATTEPQTPLNSPITVFAHHKVKAGYEPAFEQWISGITLECQAFTGYLGTEVIRPRNSAANEFVSIFRFDTEDHLEAWMSSPKREAWLSRTGEFSDEEARVDYHSLEFWFQPGNTATIPPPRRKMALVTFLALWPLVHFIPPVVGNVVHIPLVREASALAITVLLMTYVVMPNFTKLLKPWLHRNERR